MHARTFAFFRPEYCLKAVAGIVGYNEKMPTGGLSAQPRLPLRFYDSLSNS